MVKQAESLKKPRLSKQFIWLGAIVVFVLVVVLGQFGAKYFGTPEHIRNPQLEHAHLRLQILIDGKAENFAGEPYQHPYDSSFCSDEISPEPFHFHDHLDQFLHIHWQDMTGGELLKYYGWNLGDHDSGFLGYRYERGFLRPEKVSVHGKNLPVPPKEAQYFIYVGDENGYEKKNWEDFLSQDLETFLGRESSFPTSSDSSFLKSLLDPTAYAHGGIDDGHTENTTSLNLEEVQNLLGNIVIFAQQQEPIADRVQERFDGLIPLPQSSCGG